MSNGEAVQVSGEVVSVKPKWDRYDPDATGVVVRNEDGGAYWFRWSPKRGKLNVGDQVALTAQESGQGKPDSKGRTMIFLKRVQIKGTPECGHAVVVQQGGIYYCDACGEPMTVAATASLESPKQEKGKTKR